MKSILHIRINSAALALGLVLFSTSSFSANAPITVFKYAKDYTQSGILGNPTATIDKQSGTLELPLTYKGIWFCYPKVDFGTGSFTRFEVYARGLVKIDLRLDSSTNPSVGSVTVGSWSTSKPVDTMVTVGITIPAVTGVHDVYLLCSDWIDYASWGWIYSFSFAGTTPITQPRTFYVANSGSDADSGTITKPFRTISNAAKIMVAGDVCYVRKGIYSETLRPANSGTAGAPIRFEAYNGEPVVISAADRIDGWQKFQGNIYRAPMSFDRGPGYNQLYADTELVYEARFPNINMDMKVMTTLPCYNFDTIVGYAAACLWKFPHPFLKRNLSLPVCYAFGKGTDKWVDGGIGKEMADTAWAEFSYSGLTGKGVDAFKGGTLWKEGYFSSESAIITGSKDIPGGIHLSLRIDRWYGSENFGFISGPLALLDTQNEWAYKDGYAYVWLPSDANPSTLYMSAKHRTQVIDLSQRSDITIKGIRAIGGLLTMKDSRRCVIENSHFKYLSHYINSYNGTLVQSATDTLWKSMFKGVYISGNDNLITKSSFDYAAGSPFNLAGLRNVIDNCDIGNFGYSSSASGDILGQECIIKWSSIHDAGRACIAIGSLIQRAANKLLYCDFYNSGLFSTDGGTYYSYGPTGYDSEIAYNWWRNNLTTGPTSYMYFDGGGAGGIKIHHNVMFPHVRKGSSTSIAFALPTNPTKLYNNTVVMSSTDNMKNWYDIWDQCNFATSQICSANNLDIALQPMASCNFVDTIKDFSLMAKSPAINAGKVLAEKDFPGSAVSDGKPDLGAYEYGSQVWHPGRTWNKAALPSLIELSSGLVAIRSTSKELVPVVAKFRRTANSFEFSMQKMGEIQMSVFSVSGRCVATIRSKGTKVSMPISKFSSGIYTVSVTAQNIQLVQKEIVTK